MKKNILFLLVLSVIFACSPRKNSAINRTYQNFTTYYNTLFNAEDAIKTEIKNRKTSYKDNFYTPYIKLLTYEEQVVGAKIEESEVFTGKAGIPPTDFYKEDGGSNQPKNLTALEIAEAKALKAIEKHKMLFNGVEKNKRIFDAHILLAQSRILQNKPSDALEALDYLFKNMKKDKNLPLAKIYQGLAFSKMQDYYRANEVFLSLKNDKLKKNQKKLLSLYKSEMLLSWGKKEEAVEELNNAYSLNKNKEIRSRIAFLRGQILAKLGKQEEARESFVTAYKNARNFEFEVKSQIEIAKTFNGKEDDYNGAKEYIEKISKKGTYASRKNEFLYALGLMANKAGKKEEAQDYFHQSTKEKISDSQIRGLAYYEIGKSYFDKNDYLSAGLYYDSAYAAMNYAPTKEELKSLTTNIKQISKNYYLIKKNDSILSITKMSDTEKTSYFKNYITKLQEKEAKEELERKKTEKEKNSKFETTNFTLLNTTESNVGFADFSGAKGGFYFSNQSTVSNGETEFKRIWGDRVLSDNWRTSARMNSIEDLRNESLGITSTANPRRFEPDFYIEKLPKEQTELLKLKKERDTASLGLGRMYENFFGNTSLSTKTLYDLVDSKTDEETEIQALYLIFSMNYEKNPAAAERAKQLILQKYPYTSYAEFVKNPKNSNFSSSDADVEKAYINAFQLYSDGKYEDSQKLVEESLQKYPKDVLVPKFTLLQAFNTGKTAGKEIMILQLEQIVLNYGKTPEGLKAKEMLKYLKSDIKTEQFDEKGNPIPQKVSETNVTQENPQNMQQENPQQLLQQKKREAAMQNKIPEEIKDEPIKIKN